MAKRILIVDDESDILEILRFNLEMEGYEVETREAPVADIDILPDLILLDVMMAPISGFEWARQLKSDSRTANIPIIFCTAKTTEYDTLTGFALGSDDYICKPFRISEVKARVKAVLRRASRNDQLGDKETTAQPCNRRQTESRENSFSMPRCEGGRPKVNRITAPQNTISYEGLTLNLDRKECHVDGVSVAFTKLEFELLALLLSKPGQLFSRNQILSTVWPEDAMVLDRTVDVNHSYQEKDRTVRSMSENKNRLRIHV